MLSYSTNTNAHSSNSLYSKEHSSSIVENSNPYSISTSTSRIRCTTVVLRIAVAVEPNNAYACS